MKELHVGRSKFKLVNISAGKFLRDIKSIIAMMGAVFYGLAGRAMGLKAIPCM